MTKLRLTYTKGSHKVERAPRFRLAHFGIFAIVAVFGLASVLGVMFTVQGFDLDDALKPYAVTLGGVLAFCVAIVPVFMAPAWATAKGWAKVSGLAIIACLMALDAGLQVNAVASFERLAGGEKVETARNALVAAQGNIDDLPTSQEVCIGHGPQNCATRREGLKDDRSALMVERETAEEALKAAEASSLPIALILLMMSGFQLSTFFARAWLSSVTAQTAAAIEASIEEAKATKVDETVKNLRKQVRDLKGDLKAAKPAKRAAPKLKLVAAND
jgi:cell division protein FtsB